MDGEVYGIDGVDADGMDGVEADILGALWRRRKRRGAPPPRGAMVPRTSGGERIYSSPPLPRDPTQQNTAQLRSFLGVGTATWAPTDVTDKALIVEPQESFRGERLILDVAAAGGTSAGLVVLRRIDIGTMPQSPSVEQPAPAVMFRADATNANLDLQIAYRANKIQLTLGITAAPGTGVTVTCVAGFFGQWIR
jgi:hypothetical protein